jgi:hypothetical protein
MIPGTCFAGFVQIKIVVNNFMFAHKISSRGLDQLGLLVGNGMGSQYQFPTFLESLGWEWMGFDYVT